MHLLKFSLDLFDRLSLKLGIWRFSGLVSRHGPAEGECQRFSFLEGGAAHGTTNTARRAANATI